MRTIPLVNWTLRHYDRNGNPSLAADYGNSPGGASNEIRHATNRSAIFPLNGLDELSFALYLEDPMAAVINPLTSFVKLWRSGSGYSDPFNRPCFGGIVVQKIMRGESGIAEFKVFSPLWRLQSRFHILNHYLNINVDTGSLYTHSELMWKLIDLVNEAFGLQAGFTGINQGTFSWANDPIVAPYFQSRGSNTWSLIFDDLMARDGAPDIIPEYTHEDGNPEIMLFSTAERRGGGGASFNYRVGTSNLDDIVETELVAPGEYANYVWIVGHGGPNSGKIAKAEDVSGQYGYMNIGIYMKRIDIENFKRYDSKMRRVAVAELAQSKIPKSSYEVTVAPGGPLMFARDFNVGDLSSVNASKGALQVAKGQRIYQISISNSDNNMETALPLLSDDFYSSKNNVYED